MSNGTPSAVLENALAVADALGPMLSEKFDGILMLTHSEWHKEPGSNRDQYARRLAKYLPVILVQPFLREPTWHLEATEVPNLAILNIGKPYGLAGALRLNDALKEIGWENPLVWSFNPRFVDFIELRPELYSLYHATENYVGNTDGVIGFNDAHTLPLRAMLQLVDLLVSVAEGVTVDHRLYGPYDGPALTISNGCDYRLWSGFGEISYAPPPGRKPVIFYEGYINTRLDFELLEHLFELLPEWEWWFAGMEDPPLPAEWERLRARGNLKYLGHLPLRDIALNGKQATVGIIPFKIVPILVRSWPFKAFEYVSCGLPVVSTPVDALRDFPHLFRIAETAEEFAQNIREAAKERYSKTAIDTRLREAAANSYDARFAQLLTELTRLVEARARRPRPGSIIAAALPPAATIALLPGGDAPPILRQLLGDYVPVMPRPEFEPDREFDLVIATTPEAAEAFAAVPARARCAWLEESPLGSDGTLGVERLLQIVDLMSSADVIVWTEDVGRLMVRQLAAPKDKPIIDLNAPAMKPQGALAPLAAAMKESPGRISEVVDFWREMRALSAEVAELS